MNPVTEAVLSTRLVAIIRMERYVNAVKTAQALQAGGLRVLEYSLSGTGALEAIAQARNALDGEVFIGAGTILNVKDAEDAFAAGAEFIVTPVLSVPVIEVCRKRGVPILCGGFTATEVYTAHQAGADLVKLFPARLGGPQYVRDLLAPLPFLRLVPTGGVGAENARSYLEAGAAAVAVGGSLVSGRDAAEGDWAAVTAGAQALYQATNSSTF